MADATTTLAALKEAMRAFVAERRWEPYHSPKNLVMALAVETAELTEHFLWLTEEQSRALARDPDRREAVAEELADVACQVFNLSNVLDIDLSEAIEAKMAKNARKYPTPVDGAGAGGTA